MFIGNFSAEPQFCSYVEMLHLSGTPYISWTRFGQSRTRIDRINMRIYRNKPFNKQRSTIMQKSRRDVLVFCDLTRTSISMTRTAAQHDCSTCPNQPNLGTANAIQFFRNRRQSSSSAEESSDFDEMLEWFDKWPSRRSIQNSGNTLLH
jgi:hypothetical protein